MKIDILIGVGYKGGVENVVNRTAEFIKEAGHQVRIIQLIWLDYSWATSKVDFYTLSESGESKPGDHAFFSERYNLFLNEHGTPDMIFATGWPITVVIAENALALQKSRAAVVSWLHGSIEACDQIGVGGIDELRSADAHLAINHKLAAQLQEEVTGKIIEVVNPVDISRITYSENRNTHKLAFVGRIAPEKNLQFVIDALQYASPVWTLDVVGDSDEDGSGVRVMKEYCRQLGVENRVTFYGWLDRPWDVLTDAFALVLPSLREGSPLVVVEAMLCGMPVISTPTDGVLDKIVPGKNGYLFPYNDTEMFLKILRLQENGTLPQILPGSVRDSMKHVINDEPLRNMLNECLAFYEDRFS